MSINRTIRLFVSSTFEDFKAERKALHENVFPELQKFCESKKLRFQAVDLRWGVSDEAALEQQTMNICLDEIKRCQEVSPHFNFIVLLGDRYGWIPLTPQVEKTEFEEILSRVKESDKTLLAQWYHLDTNAVPPEYVLKPRQENFLARLNYYSWSQTEKLLHAIFLDAIKCLGWPANDTRRNKYQYSATHQEIIEGALKEPDKRGRVFAFLRNIQNLNDLPHGKIYTDDDVAKTQAVQALKEEIKQTINKSHIFSYDVTWNGTKLDSYIEKFTAYAFTSLCQIIGKEFSDLELTDNLPREKDIHKEFGAERCRHFIGRQKVMEDIAAYIQGEQNTPLVIYGPSGSGKSALMAKAFFDTEAKYKSACMICRFIGATPESTDIRSLLENLVREITQAYLDNITSIPTEYKDLKEVLPKRLKLATKEKPLLLFLDALDQLNASDNIHSLNWLPSLLPASVRLVVSMLEQEDNAGQCLRSAKSKFPESMLLRLEDMTPNEGEMLLGKWLLEAYPEKKRTLTDEQRKNVLEGFYNCSKPLYLKLAFEEARQWKAYDGLPCGVNDVPGLACDVPGIVGNMLERVKKQHGEVLVKTFLALLSTARYGLSETEILELLSKDVSVMADLKARSSSSPKAENIPTIVWIRLYYDLAPYLLEKSAENTVLLDFYHQQVGETVKRDYVKPEWHNRLARYFRSKADPGEDQSWTGDSWRGLSELPYHLIKEKQWVAIEETLCDISFIEARIVVGMGYRTLPDYSLTADESSNQKQLSPMESNMIAMVSIMGKALASILEIVIGDPLLLGAQLYLELELQKQERLHVQYLQKHIEQQMKDRMWLKIESISTRPQWHYISQVGLQQEYIHYLHFSPDEKSLIFVDGHGKICLWNWHDNILSNSSVPANGHFRSATLLSDTELLITNKNELWSYEAPLLKREYRSIWKGNLDSGTWQQIYQVEQNTRHLCVSGNLGAGYILLAQCCDGHNSLFRISASSKQIEVTGILPIIDSSDIVNHIAISKYGKLRAMVLGTGKLIISTGWEGWAHEGGAFHCEFICNDTQIASIGDDGTCAIWDPRKGLVHRIELLKGGKGDCLSYSSDKNMIAAGHQSGYVTFIQLDPLPRIRAGFYPGVKGWIMSLAFSPKGKYLAVGGRNGVVRIFELESLLQELDNIDPDSRLDFHLSPPVEQLTFISEKEYIGLDHAGYLFSSSSELLTNYLPLRCKGFCYDSVNDKVVVAFPDEFSIREPRSGKPHRSFPYKAYRHPLSMSISSDRKWLAVLEPRRLVMYVLGDQLLEKWSIPVTCLIAHDDKGVGHMQFRRNIPILFNHENSFLFVPAEPLQNPVVREMNLIKNEIIYYNNLYVLDVFSGSRVSDIKYEGFCTALAEDPDRNLLIMGLGNIRIPIKMDGEKYPSQFINFPSSSPGIILYSTQDWSMLRNCDYPLPMDNSGITGICLDSTTGILIIGCSSGAVIVYRFSKRGCAPLEMERLTAIRLPNSVQCITIKANEKKVGILDNGVSTDGWPVLYQFDVMEPGS